MWANQCVNKYYGENEERCTNIQVSSRFWKIITKYSFITYHCTILYSYYQNLAVETFQHKINYVYTYYYHFVHQGNQWKLNEEMIRKLQNSVFKESWFWILTSLFNFKSCMFGQARCVDPTIDIMKVGHCHTGTTHPSHVTTHPPHITTTVPTTTTTMDYQMQLVCANAALITCTNEISLICGSDYKLYQNR